MGIMERFQKNKINLRYPLTWGIFYYNIIHVINNRNEENK